MALIRQNRFEEGKSLAAELRPWAEANDEYILPDWDLLFAITRDEAYILAGEGHKAEALDVYHAAFLKIIESIDSRSQNLYVNAFEVWKLLFELQRHVEVIIVVEEVFSKVAL